MIRMILGSAIAAVAMLVVGFLLYATPLSRLGTGHVTSIEATLVQNVLKDNLKSTGTYAVPDPDEGNQVAQYVAGPIATIHYNAQGQAPGEAGMFVAGLALNFVTALLIGLGLIGIDGRVQDFGSRARLVAALAVGAAVFMHIGRPIYMHHDWANAVFSMFADGLALAVGGVIVAWFMPHRRDKAAPSNAPVEE